METLFALLVTLCLAVAVVSAVLGAFALMLMWPLFVVPVVLILIVWFIIYGLWKDNETTFDPPENRHMSTNRHE